MYVTVFMYQLLRSCVCGAKDKYIYWVIFGIDMLSKSTSKFFKSRRWVKVLGMRLNCNWGNPHNYFQWIFTILVANHHTRILILRSSILHAWQVLYQNTTNYKITWHEPKINDVEQLFKIFLEWELMCSTTSWSMPNINYVKDLSFWQ